MRGTHLLSVYVPDQGLVLVDPAVDRKENEIVERLIWHENIAATPGKSYTA